VTDHTKTVDEFGELDRRVQEFKPVANQHAKLKAEIQSWYDAAPADTTDVVEGQKFSVQISARGNERKITNMLKAYRLLGLQTFLEHCTIALKVIDKLIDPEKHKSFIEETQTGSRRLTAVAKAAPSLA
jgi:hypothetical protein